MPGEGRSPLREGGAARAPSFLVPFLFLSWLVSLTSHSGCSDSNLSPKDRDQPPAVDNLLSISGSICTDPPEATNYPVKILFVIDTSGSMQFTDPNKRIEQAVSGLVDRLKANPSVTFGLITFNGIIRVNSADPTPTAQNPNTPFDHVTAQSLGKNPNFLPGSDPVIQSAIPSITLRDAVTDYQGALGATYRVLARHDQRLSRGHDPQQVRLRLPLRWMAEPAVRRQLHEPAGVQPVCADRTTLPAYLQNDSSPELKTCQASTTSPTRFTPRSTRSMRRAILSVGDMRFHTVWLRDPNDMVSGMFGYNPDDAKMLLSTMALDHGNGTFADFYKGDDVNFTKVDYSAILRPFGLAQVLAFNQNAKPGPSAYIVDTDGDGLSDDEEYMLGTDPLQVDTDGDGYSDGFEQQRLAQGFDPKDPNKPFYPCTDRSDLDGDGLLDCEEAVVGTDPRLMDSDGDHIPDGLEVRYGTDPLTPDDAIDSDADGVFNLQEFAAHTDPQNVDPVLYRDHRASYSIVDKGQDAGQRHCYDFTADHIELASTLGQKGAATRGVNRVFLYFGQAPTDSGAHDPGRWRVACVDPVWVAPMFKLPATGQIQSRTPTSTTPRPSIPRGSACR